MKAHRSSFTVRHSAPLFAHSRRTAEVKAFSLVEVTLAIGIVAFAFVALMALLPTGMGVFRQAMDTSVTAQIAQRIATELQSSDYYTLLRQTSLDGNDSDPTKQSDPSYGALPKRFFDDQGNEVVTSGDEPTPEERARILYEVNVRLSRERLVPAGAAKGGSEEHVGSRNLATATIQIMNNPGGKVLKPDDTTKLVNARSANVPLQTYSALISRNGSEARF